MRKRFAFAALLASSLVSAASGVANAKSDETLAPGTIAIVGPVELQNDWTVRTSPGGGERSNLTTKVEPEITFQASESVSFLLGVTLEQIAAPTRGDSEAFENQALYIKTLTANYEGDGFAFFAGKFTANFGRAWDAAPGIYGDRFAKDYEFAERWGAGGSLLFEGLPVGDIEFGASLFMVDRTALSDSWITRRGRTTESDGGPGNTDRPTSFALSLDGVNERVLDGVEWHLAYTHQARGEGDTGNLRGIVAGAQITLPLSADVTATPLVEWARFDNFGGVQGADRRLWTAAVQFDWRAWQFVAAYATRDLSDPDSGKDDDRSLELSVGFRFDNGLLAEAGWWRVEEAGESADIIGMRLSFEFDARFRLY